uniref:Kinesin motor domain-containing protein n=1 Tax=Stegastes partitus TaxID=144197 RepID=A0A3B5ABN7_9TELE
VKKMTEESAVKVCVRLTGFQLRIVLAKANAMFTAEETTNQLYQNIAKPLVVSTVEGYNGTIFAYGQTSSGKTFTMMGSDHIPGVIPLAVDDVFQTIKTVITLSHKEFLLRVSYMEIYNETVTDLFRCPHRDANRQPSCCEATVLPTVPPCSPAS